MSEDWKAGIVVLKDTALYEPGIERLGPPPGNAEILIRGGAGWALGLPRTRETISPQVIRLTIRPSFDEVALALAREMAWRWYYGYENRDGNVVKPGEKEFPQMARNFVKYADAERGFVEQFLQLYPGVPARRVAPRAPIEQVLELAPARSPTAACACIEGISCCAGVCQSCQEG